MNLDQANEVSLVEWQVRNKLRKMVDEIATGTLAQILAQRLSSDQTSFVTCQKLLSGLTTHTTLCEGKYELQVSLVLSKLPSQTFDTYGENGRKIRKRKLFWE